MSYYDDDGSRQSRRIHNMGVEEVHNPSPAAQAPQPLIPNFGTQSQTNDIDLLDIQPTDSNSFATQSFQTNNHVLMRETVISPVTIAPQQEAPLSSSGSVTSVYVQGDPPGFNHHNPSPTTTQQWNIVQPQFEPQNFNTVPGASVNTPNTMGIQQHQEINAITMLQENHVNLQQEVQILNHRLNNINASMNNQYTTLIGKLEQLIYSQFIVRTTNQGNLYHQWKHQE